MKSTFLGSIISVLCLAGTAQAALITNGGFESGLAGWTAVDQLGSDGTFFAQSGAASPVNLFPVPAPAEGTTAAMTDAEGPGAHVLYQDFLVPLVVPNAIFTFSYYLNNGAGDYSIPALLDFSTPALNQQARIDIITTGADVFSVALADVLQNLFQTTLASPAVTPGYVSAQVDVTSLLQAQAGQTLRLRLSQTDNVSFFNFGVDAVDFNVSAVPEPSTFGLSALALAGLVLMRRRSVQ